MKAHLKSARIAPKKANIIAKMVRGMPVTEAIDVLSRTNKKSARMVEDLLKSAVANAEHNDKQKKQDLVVKTIVVNQGMGYSRGVPKARGSVRPMMKFLSHISVTLGIGSDDKPVVKGSGKGNKGSGKRDQGSGKQSPSSKSSASSDSSASSVSSDSSPKSSSQKTETPVQKSSSQKTDAKTATDSSTPDSKVQPKSDGAASSDSSSSAS